MAEPDFIAIRGACEHNLKSVSLDVPKKKLVVFSGVSGSGKSSLAFDTLYAEGQRRYVESLSAYARQFLGQMEKPKYETLRGLSPTISIEQKSASNNPRSTVGTVTEVHDYLRVLYASIGIQHCWKCGRRVGRQSAQAIVDEVLKSPTGTRMMLLAPLVQDRKGEHRDVLADAAKRGFARARIDGKVHGLEERIDLDKKAKHTIEVVVDRLVLKPEVRPRLTDSVETALREGKGVLLVTDESGGQERVMSELNACHSCGLSFPELTPASFSFNSPLGMCPDCNGLGTRPEMDPDLIVPDQRRTIREGAVEPWATGMVKGEGWTAEFVEQFARAFKVDLDTPWEKLSKRERDVVLNGSGGKSFSVRGWKMEWEGMVHKLMRSFRTTHSEAMRKYYQKFFSPRPCTSCSGERLRLEARSVRVHATTIVELSRLTVGDARTFLAGLQLLPHEEPVARELLREIQSRLGFLVDVGLGYLTLERSATTLSGGESQRIRLASQMGSELTGVIYILDEPSIGLHQRDNGKLLGTLKRLRDLGNSVIVVEHDEETMREADWLVDFGPGAGELGGQVVAQGTPAEVTADPRSLTGAYLAGRTSIEIPPRRRRPGPGKLVVEGARANNLQDLTVEFPLGLLVAVTGVSGAGKSTLVNEVLYPALAQKLHGSREVPGRHRALKGVELVDKVVDIDQRPIGRTPRSNPATYTKVFDAIRDVFALTQEARAFGYGPGRFSFNIKGGRCEACGGDGVKLVEMHFLADVYVPCEVCGGKRFNDATLRVRFKGKNIAEVLGMSVHEAREHFSVHREIARILGTLEDVGLGYVRLGQSSPTLSGGEAQRIKLSRELARVATGKTFYILDEPTTGLHFDDIRKLLRVLDQLVEAGNTVVVIEHNLDVIKSADHVIDLGPEGGAGGGRVLATGTPEEVARVSASFTGQYLARVLGVPGAKRSSRSTVATA
jgi:excinuclease ABC subunit A